MAILINGSASKFFHPGRGLRQGCALSPLLFILVMDALSLRINRAVAQGTFKGIEIGPQLKTSHSLFVDDILIFGMLVKASWVAFYDIFNIFCVAAGMIISVDKSCLYCTTGHDPKFDEVVELFGFKKAFLEAGLTYLGFRVQALTYYVKDPEWLIHKYRKRLNSWTANFLS